MTSQIILPMAYIRYRKQPDSFTFLGLAPTALAYQQLRDAPAVEHLSTDISWASLSHRLISEFAPPVGGCGGFIIQLYK